MTDGANLPLSFTKGNALLGWRVTFATSARQGRKNEGNANIPRRLRGVSGFAYSSAPTREPRRQLFSYDAARPFDKHLLPAPAHRLLCGFHPQAAHKLARAALRARAPALEGPGDGAILEALREAASVSARRKDRVPCAEQVMRLLESTSPARPRRPRACVRARAKVAEQIEVTAIRRYAFRAEGVVLPPSLSPYRDSTTV